MKGAALVLLLIHCLVVFGKPRPKRLAKRAVGPSQNLAAFRQDQLNLHNYYRQQHGVSPLTLDTVLTKEAQDYAEYLKTNNMFQHCGATTCNPSAAGESLANVTNATLHWYNEVQDYNYCSFPQGRATTRPGSEGKMIFHFTQVVWTATTKLGIGYAQSTDGKKVYVVARYFPAGNFFGQFTDNVPRAPYLLNKYQNNCNAVNGGLTEWSEPGLCTKTCGGGIKYQTRLCANPKPSYNGRDCSGETKRVYPYWCNSQACTTPVDERAEQCKNRGYTTKSYAFGGAHECTLFCEQLKLSNFYVKRGPVDDGTHCQNGKGACVDGVCILLDEEPVTTAAPGSNISGTTQGPTNQPTTVPQTTTTIAVTTLPPTTTAAPTTTQPPITTTTGPPTTPPTTFPFIVINGGYSEWGQPGACSKTCGGGISFRTRTCLSPQPNGGCIGPSMEVYKVWCNPQPCDPPTPKRSMQCESRGHEPEGHNFGGVDECYLYCRDSQTGYYFYSGAVDAGTPCNKTAGACVDNVCVPMMYEPGTVIEGIYTAVPSEYYWKNIIVAIPNGATNVKILHNNRDAEAVVGYRSSLSYGYDATRVVKGVRVIYHSNGDITIDGPVNPSGDYQIVVYALGDTQADIVFKYTAPVTQVPVL